MIELYLAGVILMFLSGLPALAGNLRGERLSAFVLLAGCGLALAGTMAGAFQEQAPRLSLAWSMPGGSLSFALDALAAVFLLPALIVIGLGGVYGLGYFPAASHGPAAARLRLFYGGLSGAIALIPACANSLLFLMAWEVMALCCFFLILSEPQEEATRRAAYIYLAATHTCTLALFALFILLAGETGDFAFPAAGTLAGAAPQAGAVFLLALFGFGLKAGMMPMHFWLPGAHAAAPSHVSAVMSGVMLKMGIYGLVRVSGFYAGQPAWWGWSLLAAGTLSAIMGVAFALAQHDLKRLLAYHSVENIGIILIGLGGALLGKAFHSPALTALALAGALLHVANHGLFKALLFLGAGSLIRATGTRELDRYGGLLKTMPLTAFLFLGGAVAICGLPPLNGFISEWLIYLGLLQSQAAGAGLPLSLAVLAAPALALTGALAVACFVKVFGITFLGAPRKEFIPPPGEATKSMLFPMALLFFCCLLIGLAPASVLPLLQRALVAWIGPAPAAPLPGGMLLADLAPAWWISLATFLLLATAAILFLRQRQTTREAEEGGRPSTWGCGWRQATPRMSYTASSFAELLTGLFDWGLRSDINTGRAVGFFPGLSRFAAHTPDLILDRLLIPFCRLFSRAAFATRAFLHQGAIGVYLLYSFFTLCLLLFWLG